MLIELRNGPVVRLDAIAIGCDLERRGHLVTARYGQLLVTNGARLTPADRAAITANRLHLIACVEYTSPEAR